MEEETKKNMKINFFKRIWYSISKIEKYPDMAAEGFKRALGYLVKIVAILTVVVCIGMIYQTNNLIQKGVSYLQNEFPEFSYKDGILDVVSDEMVKVTSDESFIGKAIVDTKIDEENKINQYINEVTENGEGIIVLKDRVIIKNSSVAGTISYAYKDTFEQMGISEFTKQDVINYANSTQIMSLYVSLFLTIFIYSFIMYFLTTISNVVLLSVFGYITTLLARIKMRYVAIFNMSVYAITLSVILNMLYIGLNTFVSFNMEYFQVMYIAVAAIYLVAAILILKADFMKKQAELTKISETEKNIEEETENNKENKKDKNKEDKNNEEQREDKKLENKSKDTESNNEEKEQDEVKKNNEIDKKTDSNKTKKKTEKKTQNKNKNKDDKKEEKGEKTKKQKNNKDENNDNLGVEPEGSNA